MKKYLTSALIVSGMLILNGCGGGSSSSNNAKTSEKSKVTNYANGGFNFEDLKGKTFYALVKDGESQESPMLKFSQKEQKVQEVKEDNKTSISEYKINKSVNGCEKGCIVVITKDDKGGDSSNLYIKAKSQDKDKISILATVKPEDIASGKSATTMYFFFDKAKRDAFKNANTKSSMQKELEFVKKHAKSLNKNAKGYWEADFGDGIVMIYIPSGKFTMGNNFLSKDIAKNTYSPTPQHEVSLSGYWIAKTPTTIGQFRSFIKDTNYKTDVEKDEYKGPYVYDFSISAFEPKKGYKWDNCFKDVTAKYPEISTNDTHPVNCISWYDAKAYTKWLKDKKGLNFTIPTEAQWEYASRGNDGRVYPWGNETPDETRANYADITFDKYFPNTEQSIVHKSVNDGFAITSPVGSFPNGASFFGALDMAGNLTEWVFDSQYDYTNKSQKDPLFVSNNQIKMQKGGFWAGSAGRANVTPDELENGHNIRSDARQGDDPHSADDHLGFRIAISYTHDK